MKRFVLMALLICGPAFAESVAEGEARLVVLSDQVAQVLQGVTLTAEGITCSTATREEDGFQRMVRPAASLACDLTGAGLAQTVIVSVMLSQDMAMTLQPQILAMRDQDQMDAKTGAPPRDVLRFYGAPQPKGLRSDSLGVVVVLSPLLVAVVKPGTEPWPLAGTGPDAVDLLAEAILAVDTVAVEQLPQIADYTAALADHVDGLTERSGRLHALFDPLPVGFARAEMAPFPPPVDGLFFQEQPVVYADVEIAGVKMVATVTGSSIHRQAFAQEGLFTGTETDGGQDPQGVYSDRGRIKLYLRDNRIIAQIDGRVLVVLTVSDAQVGSDEVAAMEAVLAHIAAMDFSDF